MNVSVSWLERGAALALACSAGATVFTAVSDRESWARFALSRYMRSLDDDLTFTRATVRGKQIVIAQGIVVALCVVCGVADEWTSWLLVPFVVLAPRFVVNARAQQRVTRLEEQIEPWLNAIANSLKASPSLGEAIASTTSLVAAPMNEEVDVLLKEYELGTPLDAALENLATRGRGRTLSGAVLALKVARRSGGNLTEMLETTVAALRELARLEGVVRTKTAEGRAQAIVIGVVPIPMVAIIHWSDPQYFAPLAATFMGNVMVGGAAALWVLAILASVKILAVDV